MFIFDIWTVRPSHILKADLFFLKEQEKCPHLYCLHAAMSLPVYELLGLSCLPKYPSKSNMQGAIPFHASLFLTVVSFINLTNWDLVQLVNEKKLSNFMIFANDSNLNTVNSGYSQSHTPEGHSNIEVKEIKQSTQTDKKMGGSDSGWESH